MFDLVRLDKTDKAYDLWLDEKKERAEDDRKNPNIVARGYTDYSVIQDFPMRGSPVYLHMRKNILWDKETGRIFSYNQDLPAAEETRLVRELVAF